MLGPAQKCSYHPHKTSSLKCIDHKGSLIRTNLRVACTIPQDSGKPSPFSPRAWQAGPSYSRVDPCGQPRATEGTHGPSHPDARTPVDPRYVHRYCWAPHGDMPYYAEHG